VAKLLMTGAVSPGEAVPPTVPVSWAGWDRMPGRTPAKANSRTSPSEDSRERSTNGSPNARRPHPKATPTGPRQGMNSSRHAPSRSRNRRGCPADHRCIRRSRTPLTSQARGRRRVRRSGASRAANDSALGARVPHPRRGRHAP
jgi:hypothetical protein